MPRGRNDYETAQIQGRLWTPQPSRPAAWYDASDLSTITNTATGVSDWADKSGNGRTMSNATVPSYRPDLAVGKRNGLSTLEFVDQTGAGSGDYRADRLQASSRVDNVRTAYVALARYGNPINGGANFVFTDPSLYPWHGPNNQSRLAEPTYSATNWRNGSNFRNGATIDVTALGSAPLDEFSVYSFLCVGTMETQGVGNDRTFHGSFGSYGEILWHTESHSTRERLLIEGYLAWKWGVTLAADHPFANRPPLIGD